MLINNKTGICRQARKTCIRESLGPGKALRGCQFTASENHIGERHRWILPAISHLTPVGAIV